MMQIFSRPFTIGNAVCHSSKVDKQLKTCNWVFAIYSFMWVAECRIILSADIRWLPFFVLYCERVIFGKTLQTVIFIPNIFIHMSVYIFYQLSVSSEPPQSRCQNILFLWSSSLWDRREDFLPIPNFWMSTESKVCVTVNSNCLFTLNSVGLMFLVLMDFKPANKCQNKGQTTLTSLKVIIKFDLCGAGLGLGLGRD